MIECITAHVKAEHEVLKQKMKKVAMVHHEEGHRNQFCQFIHDCAALKKQRQVSSDGDVIFRQRWQT